MSKEVGTNEQLNMKRPETVLETKSDIEKMTSVFQNFDPTFGDGTASNFQIPQQQSGWLKNVFSVFK